MLKHQKVFQTSGERISLFLFVIVFTSLSVTRQSSPPRPLAHRMDHHDLPSLPWLPSAPRASGFQKSILINICTCWLSGLVDATYTRIHWLGRGHHISKRFKKDNDVSRESRHISKQSWVVSASAGCFSLSIALEQQIAPVFLSHHMHHPARAHTQRRVTSETPLSKEVTTWNNMTCNNMEQQPNAVASMHLVMFKSCIV